MVRKKQFTPLTLSQAIDGFFLELRARQLSPHTLTDYRNALNKFTAYLDADPLINDIESDDVEAFLAHLSESPQPSTGAIARAARPLSNKTILNIHTALSALWTWAQRENAVEEHIIRAIPRPKPEQRAIIPLTRADVAALLNATRATNGYFQKGAWCANSRPTEVRDQAIVRMLLDTGLRASELCSLTVSDFDLKNQRLRVFGKGSKERSIPIGDRSTKALWLYLSKRQNANAVDPLFITDDGSGPLTRRTLGLLLARLGDRAGVPDVHPHRFRHTFAITYLRNAGDIYTLQLILGHTTLDMVKRYLAIAQADVQAAHRKASPVDNWKL